MEHPDSHAVSMQGFGFEAQPAHRHPVAAVFHIGFRTAALVWYIFSGALLNGRSFILAFIIQVLLLALDFWTVKNVTGRLLVGLRWWNEIREDGTSEWIFEQTEDQSAYLPSEKRLFWLGLIIAPAIWFVFGIGAVFSLLSLNPVSKLPNLLTVAVALGLTTPNLYGYFKCSKESGEGLRGLAQNYIGSAALNAAFRNVAK